MQDQGGQNNNNAEVLLNTCRDIGLAVYTIKIKYMKIGPHWGMIANEQIRISGNSYEKVESFKYLDSLEKNENSVQEENKL